MDDVQLKLYRIPRLWVGRDGHTSRSVSNEELCVCVCVCVCVQH